MFKLNDTHECALVDAIVTTPKNSLVVFTNKVDLAQFNCGGVDAPKRYTVLDTMTAICVAAAEVEDGVSLIYLEDGKDISDLYSLMNNFEAVFVVDRNGLKFEKYRGMNSFGGKCLRLTATDK